MTLTPTSQSSLFAGAVLWLVGWLTFFKADKIPFVGRFINRERMLSWMLKNKVLTLLCTEFVNFGVHNPTDPPATLFAIGGTAFNALMIFVLLPLFAWRGRKSDKRILREAI
jgi:hypothetical protein